MAIGNLYDEYLNSGDAGISAALNAAKGAASQGGGRKGALVQQPKSNFPAANDFPPSTPSGGGTPTVPPFQPSPRPSPNNYQPGSIGDNIGTGFGQSFTNPYASLFNGSSTTDTSTSRYSRNPFVEGGYNFPAGSQLPEGFQESGGGGLTRQIPQDSSQQPTVHFLPPGFTAVTGSTGTPGSTQNDIHFLPPGFSSVSGITDPKSKQLRSQPWLGGY